MMMDPFGAAFEPAEWAHAFATSPVPSTSQEYFLENVVTVLTKPAAAHERRLDAVPLEPVECPPDRDVQAVTLPD
jgi:hypothetical protein